MVLTVTAMHGTPYGNARKSVGALDPAEQLRLVAELISHLSGELNQQPRSLLELDGLGQNAGKAWTSMSICVGNPHRGMDRRPPR